MNGWLHTRRFSRGKLPHWEVLDGRYFVTVRCADSLPKNVVSRLSEIHETLRSIDTQSEQFAALQRTYFRTMEKYLDAGTGECRLRDPNAAEIVVAELRTLEELDVDVPHYSIMPNHWHAMIEPRKTCSRNLSEIMRHVKGRSSHAINALSKREGVFWQREWFDRRMRNDDEYERCVCYIRNNPVKAGFASKIGDHPWTR